MWFIGFEVEQEVRAPPPKKKPGSAPVWLHGLLSICHGISFSSLYNLGMEKPLLAVVVLFTFEVKLLKLQKF